jgi:hypothetical protein
VAGQLHMTSAMRHASDGPWATLPAATESQCCTRAASKRASSIVDLSSSASANAPLRYKCFGQTIQSCVPVILWHRR